MQSEALLIPKLCRIEKKTLFLNLKMKYDAVLLTFLRKSATESLRKPYDPPWPWGELCSSYSYVCLFLNWSFENIFD